MYEEHFGLSAKPFQLSPDARFFFPSKEHSRALSFLQYGLEQADGFIVITGDVGTGKTTLVQTLLTELNSPDLLIATIVTTQLKEDDLLQLVASNLGLKVKGNSKALLLRDLEALFIQKSREQQRVLIIVDEAQNLPPRSVEELRMLSNFQLNGKPLVQVFLLGQAEFRSTLLSEGFEQLRQRVIATYHLCPLDLKETRTYIEHRLQTAGWEHRPEIDSSAYPAIYEFSAGIPRRINNLCDRLLLFAFLEEKDVIDGDVVHAVSQEIGSEFWAGSQPKPKSAEPDESQPGRPEDVFDVRAKRSESAASGVDDDRLTTVERTLVSMGHTLTELCDMTSRFKDIEDIKTEMSYVRLLLQELVDRQRDVAEIVPNTGSMKRA